LCLANLHKFLKLKLLKLQFHKIIKILFSHVYNKICSMLYSYTSSVYLWLHIQSAINMDVIVWMCRYYIMDITNILILARC